MSLVSLNYFVPNESSIVDFSAGLRPYREGGIRMEKQLHMDKTIYHDYGHGGGGISLGYGCAQYVINTHFLPAKAGLTESVAVLGGGIIGLTTAYLLINLGYRVHIYAQLWPFERSPNQPEITTTVAAGYWMPLKLENKYQCEKYAVDTWNHYQEIEALQRQTQQKLGVTLLPVYAVNDDQNFTWMHIKGVIEPKKCLVQFGKGKQHYEAVSFHTYVIESQKYLPYLIEAMQQSGRLTVTRTTLKSISQVQALHQKHIFNCLGLGAKDIFNDPRLNKGVKGHVLKFNLPPKVSHFILFMKISSQRWVLQVPQPQTNKLTLGISYEEGKKDGFAEKEQLSRVLTTARDFFLQIEKYDMRSKL